MEKKKSNKGLIITIVILIILLLGLAGYICYDKFLTSDEKNNALDDSKKVETKPKEDTNFYSINNLVKNHYLEEITSQNGIHNDRVLIKIENGKVYVVKSLDSDSGSKYKEASGIEGTPKYVYSQYQFISAIFVVITEEGDVYSATSSMSEKTTSKPKKFTKLNTKKVKSLYSFYTYHPYEALTIYAEYDDNTFAKISPIKDSNGAATGLKMSEVSFEKEFIYPDVVMGGCDLGSETPGVYRGLFITSDRKLFNKLIVDEEGTVKYEEIKYNNESFKVKEVFSVTTSTYEGLVSPNKISYYVIDENDNIYVVKQNGSLKITSVKLHKNLKVKSYTFEENFNENYACPKNSLSITYEDNSVEKMEKDVHVSTLYERYNK